MGVYVSIRGWIETCVEQLPLIRAVIEQDEDEIGDYTHSWCFPAAGGGFSCFVFFGCTVRTVAVESLRAQVRRIAETVKTYDGESVDFPEGDFLLEHECHEGAPERYPLIRWRFGNGVFHEAEEGPLPGPSGFEGPKTLLTPP